MSSFLALWTAFSWDFSENYCNTMDPLLLDDEDYVFTGLERLQFISCRSCMRYTPFLFYLSENANNPLLFWRDHLILCANCLPAPDSLRQMYPALGNSAACNLRLVEMLKGFEYCNPYYRKYANVCRVIVTLDVPDSLEPTSKSLDELTGSFPAVHLLDNKKFYGLEEIGKTILQKVEQIRQYYSAPSVETNGHDTLPEQPESKPVIFAECLDYEPDSAPPDAHDSTIPCQDYLSPKDAILIDNNEMITETPRSKPYVAGESRFKLKVLNSKTVFACDICLLSEKDNIAYGDFIEKQQQKRTLRCHYFCLLSGTSIIQNGLDSSGILGFLLKDVYDSYQKYRTTICCYCGQPSAAIDCAESGCSRHFHYICGYKNNCMTQFTDEFNSFCHEHLPEFANKPVRNEAVKCWICWETLRKGNGPSVVYSNCELSEEDGGGVKTAWYHRYCLQRFALEAGYYFKCPNCFDKGFADQARLQGIFVPKRDASWELERGAYEDIHNAKCSNRSCQSARAGGKTQHHTLVGCKACGGETMHVACASVDDPDDYVCSKCMDATFIKLF